MPCTKCGYLRGCSCHLSEKEWEQLRIMYEPLLPQLQIVKIESPQATPKKKLTKAQKSGDFGPN